MPDDSTKRLGGMSDADRALAGRGRRSQPHAIPEPVPDEITGSYEGEELQEIRRRRPTGERVDRLEQKHDDLSKTVAKMSGQMDGQDRVLANIEGSVNRLSEREHVTLTAQVDIDKARALEPFDIRKNRRERITKAVPYVIGGIAALLEILRQSGVL